MRQSWDEYFLDIAATIASRSTCLRKSVGCVLVRNNQILASGYNGSMRGMAHCQDVGCLIENEHCVRTLHAEINAIIQCARHGTCIEGATTYITHSPCWGCFRALANSGTVKIVFSEFYKDERIFEAAKELGIKLVHLEKKDKE